MVCHFSCNPRARLSVKDLSDENLRWENYSSLAILLTLSVFFGGKEPKTKIYFAGILNCFPETETGAACKQVAQQSGFIHKVA